MKREYLILGIEPKLAHTLYDECSDIIEEFSKNKENGLYAIQVSLNWYGSIMVRIGIFGYNLGKKNKMMLVKL